MLCFLGQALPGTPLHMAGPRGCRGQDAGSSGSSLSLGPEPSSPGLLKGTEDPKRQGVRLSLQQEVRGLDDVLAVGRAWPRRAGPGERTTLWDLRGSAGGGRAEASHKMYADLCGGLCGQERRSHGTPQPDLEGAVCHISD